MSGIAAILPAFNEEVSIGSMVLRARRYADRVIVVDDGSSDRTSEVAEQAGAEVIQHSENRGKSAAHRLDKIANPDCGFHLHSCNMITPISTQKFSGDYLCP